MPILAAIGGKMGASGGAAGTFSTRAAARILAVSPERIRYWVKSRFISLSAGGGRRLRFAFDDLLTMRLAKEMLAVSRRLKPAHLTFERVRRMIGPGRPLSSIKLENLWGCIVVRDGRACFEAESGQLLLDFDRRARPGTVEERFGPARARERFEEARRLAEQDPLKALKIYSRLVEREPVDFDEHMRLAALLESEGDLKAALRHLLGAASIVPANAEVHLKLGLLYRRQDDERNAIRSLRRAIECDPALVEAHRNLVEMYEHAGRERDAKRHLNTLQRLLTGK
jgi:MerR HTH family regulatory protein